MFLVRNEKYGTLSIFVSVTKQVIKNVSQNKQVNNLPSIICVTQSLAN